MQDQIYKKLNRNRIQNVSFMYLCFDYQNMHLVFVFFSGKIIKATEDPKSSQTESGDNFSSLCLCSLPVVEGHHYAYDTGSEPL